MACMRVLQTNNLTYTEQCTICGERQVKIIRLWQVSFLICPPCLEVVPFVTFSLCLFHSLTFSRTHRFKLSIQKAQIQNQTHGRFPPSLLLFTIYRLWPQSVLLSPPSSTCSSILLFFVSLHPPVHLTWFYSASLFIFSTFLSFLSPIWMWRPLFFPPELRNKRWSLFSLYRGRWMHLRARINEWFANDPWAFIPSFVVNDAFESSSSGKTMKEECVFMCVWLKRSVGGGSKGRQRQKEAHEHHMRRILCKCNVWNSLLWLR